MKASDQEYEEAQVYLRAKLSQPQPEVERWLNSIVDAWVERRKASKQVRTRGSAGR